MPRKKSRKQLVKEADKFFSLAIRLRDSVDGRGNCITCSKELHYKDAHAGHFQKRKYLTNRWDEENVNLQCAGCNTYNDGEQHRHGLQIDLKYGDGTAKKLDKQARAGIGQKFPSAQIEEIIHDAKEQIRFYENVDK